MPRSPKCYDMLSQLKDVLKVFLISFMRATCPVSVILLGLIIFIKFGEDC